MTDVANLAKLKELLDGGILSQEEFEKEKQKLLNAQGADLATSGTHSQDLPPEVESNLGIFSTHKIKNAEMYGGWSKGGMIGLSILCVLFPIGGLIAGIVGASNASRVKKSQGKALIFTSIFMMGFYLLKFGG